MIRSALYTLLFCWLPGFVMAQGLCDNLPANAVVGSFKIDGDITAGCSPLNISVTDLSGGTNIKYVYDYDGDPDYNRLLGTTSNSQPLISTEPKEFTILQYGDLNGKAMYACQKVMVLPKITYSVTTCDSDLRIQIPAQPAITGSPNYKYKVGSSPEVSVNNLPYYSADIPVTYPVQVNVYVTDASGAISCNASPQVINSRYENDSALDIAKLEVVDNQNAVITLKGSYDLSSNPIEVFRIPYDWDLDFTNNSKIVQTFSPGENKVSIPDDSKSFCFYAITDISCGQERSSVICTIPLDPITPLPDQNVLNWSNHRDKINGPSGDPAIYNRQITNSEIIIEQVGGTSSVQTFLLPQKTYTHNINCTQEYCYQVISTIEDRRPPRQHKAQSLSLKRCISRQSIKVPAITDVFVSVDNGIHINYIDNSGWSLNKTEFQLYHSTSTGDTKIDDSPTLTPFVVNTLEPNTDSHCFKIAYTDQCGSTSDLSPEVCTVFLSYDGTALNWTSDFPFSPEAIQHFEIEEIAIPVPPVITKANTEFSETLNLSMREDIIKYRIKAISFSGRVSLSNVLEVSPTFQLHVPTAFTPNLDSHNPTLKVFAKKNMIQDFRIEIFNRFGTKVYTSTDKNFEWDGTFNKNEVEAGLYTLVISAQLTTGEKVNSKEMLHILR